MEQRSIRISVPDERKRRRRIKRLIWGGVGLLILALVSLLEIYFLKLEPYFLLLINIDFVLFIIILIVVTRYVVRLVLERRRKVLGARLRTKLVLAFMSLSLIPTALMFIVGIKLVQHSVDYWFTARVEDTMEEARQVGLEYSDYARERLGRRATSILRQIEALDAPWGGTEMNELLKEKYQEYELIMLGVVGPEGEDRSWHSTLRFVQAWREIKPTIDWELLKRSPQYWSFLWPGAVSDYAMGVMPVEDGRLGYLVLGQRVGSGLIHRIEEIKAGYAEYKNLKSQKIPLTINLSFVMALMALLIVLGAVWFGFRLAKEMAAPIQALAQGTKRIARGDLSVRLEDESTDEFNVLVRSFNTMAEDLEQSRQELTGVNEQLARQNVELEHRGRYIEAVLDNTTAGVVSLDARGRVETINKAAADILGLQPAEAMGMLVSKMPGVDKELAEQVLSDLATGDLKQWQRQLDLEVGGQQRRLLVGIVPLDTRGRGETGFVAVFEDITELEKMHRMEAWREVARRIAHEIKNPLTPIKLSAQRLERKFAGTVQDEAFVQCTGLIVRQVEYLQEMVKEFSAFAKLPEMVLVSGHLEPIVSDVVGLYRMGHAEIEWSLKVESPLPRARIDEKGIRQVLANVLSNAVEALENVPRARVEVSLFLDSVRRKLRLEVSDNGPGLSGTDASRLFEPYFSRKKGGTGLGLTIVKSIINDHHGYVRIRNRDGGGLTLSIELPVE